MSPTVRITEREIDRDMDAAIYKAMVARERGDVLEVPWWFYPVALSNPHFRRGEQHPLSFRNGGSREEP